MPLVKLSLMDLRRNKVLRMVVLPEPEGPESIKILVAINII
jgi:hypothetical protein